MSLKVPQAVKSRRLIYTGYVLEHYRFPLFTPWRFPVRAVWTPTRKKENHTFLLVVENFFQHFKRFWNWDLSGGVEMKKATLRLNLTAFMLPDLFIRGRNFGDTAMKQSWVNFHCHEEQLDNTEQHKEHMKKKKKPVKQCRYECSSDWRWINIIQQVSQFLLSTGRNKANKGETPSRIALNSRARPLIWRCSENSEFLRRPLSFWNSIINHKQNRYERANLRHTQLMEFIYSHTELFWKSVWL